jgi:hypothetical protein
MIDQSKQKDISQLPAISRDRYENIFNVYTAKKDDSTYYYYNILKKISIDTENIAPGAFKYIQVNRRLPWTAISYQEYSTQHLWWLILLTNNIINPIILPKIGDVLKIVRQEYVKEIISQLNN